MAEKTPKADWLREMRESGAKQRGGGKMRAEHKQLRAKTHRPAKSTATRKR